MTVNAHIPAQETNGTALYRDFLSSSGASLAPWIPAFGLDACARAARGEPRVDAALVSSLRARNQALGVDADVCARLDGLGAGSVRAVVTGQQPGVAGGPLMSLHKAAAAIALAARIESTARRACVPLFWLGSDDDDFAEIRELSVLGADYSRLDVSIDAAAYRPGLRVGDIDAAAVGAVWNAVRPVLPPGSALDRITGDLGGAADFADAAARALVAATGGRIAIVDGRDPALRTAARDLLLAFFDREPVLRERLDAGGRQLEARGYHAQVQWGGDSGLFLVRDGVRRRVSPDRRETARAEFVRDITAVSPGVVARNLVQDSVFEPAAVVLGPAEVAYRAQMAGVYAEMGVAMPVVIPRLSATYLPPAVRDMVRALELDAAAIARDPGGVAAMVAGRSLDNGLRTAAASLEASFSGGTRAFIEAASSRLDDRAREKLRKRIDEITARLSQTLATALEHDTEGPRARWPFLPRMADIFSKDTRPQERFLSLVTPMLFHGDDAWPAVDALAREWAADALDGRVWHGVYSV